MKFCLLTDLHMNRYPRFFNKRLLRKAKDCDALLVMGDITTGLHTEKHLEMLGNSCKDVYFVLGNHDFYTSSFQEVSIKVKEFCNGKNLWWLDDEEPVEVFPGTWLLGVDGWYDGAHGDTFFMDINFDRMMIKDLLLKRRMEERAALIRERSEFFAEKFSQKMQKVPMDAKRVVVATHYPPWMGPIRHILDAFWLPQSVNSTLALALEKAAAERLETDFQIFCGHVHKTYEVRPAENVHCSVLDARKPIVVDFNVSKKIVL